MKRFFDLMDSESLFFILLKVAGFFLIVFILGFFSKKLINLISKRIIKKTHFKWDHLLYENKILESISYVFPLLIGSSLAKLFFKKKEIVGNEFDLFLLLNKILTIFIIVILLQFSLRVINFIMQIATNENNHQTVAIKAFFQILKIFSVLVGSLIIISILIESNLSTIITGLGTLTAVLILVFKDPILGFVSGIQIASNKMIKVGDWIAVPKYQIDGNVAEINLLTAKIENFDRTLSTIPTYDLISSAITNYEMMRQKNIRRIKRAILFNTHSFKFFEEAKLEKFKNFHLITKYIEEKQKEIHKFNQEKKIQNPHINGRKLTNIGLFRQYALSYLKSHPEVFQFEIVMVRQLSPTSYGLPLEIYCFSNTSIWVEYERIQSDIFDHLMSICKEFELELAQIMNFEAN